VQLTFAPLANAAWGFSRRYWRLVVVAMLALLHVAVFRGVADPWARALLLAHLGLLLLWQLFLRAERRVSAPRGVVLVGVAFTVMLQLDWWLLAFWVIVLAGLVGGKVYQQNAKWQRRAYLVVLAYLLALLAVPSLWRRRPRRTPTVDPRSNGHAHRDGGAFTAEVLGPISLVVPVGDAESRTVEARAAGDEDVTLALERVGDLDVLVRNAPADARARCGAESWSDLPPTGHGSFRCHVGDALDIEGAGELRRFPIGVELGETRYVELRWD